MSVQATSVPSRPWWKSPLAAIIVSAALASLLGFAGTLGDSFVSEDFATVARFSAMEFREWPRLVVADWSGGMWEDPLPELRPIVALTFMIDAQVWGLNPLGYRLSSLFFHAACAALVGLIAYRAVGRDARCGAIAAVLFALHPVHVFVVAPICGRGDSIASAFFLAGFLAFLKFRETGKGRWLAVLAGTYTLAAFSKEYGFTLPLLLLVADGTWLRHQQSWRRRATWAPYAWTLAIAGVYFACRQVAFGESAAGAARLDLSELWTRLGDYHRSYAYHLFPPLNDLRAAWRSTERALAVGLALQGALALAAGGILLVFWRRRLPDEPPAGLPRAGLSFCLGWYLVTTGLFVLTYFAPRHLYLASAGVCLALVIALGHARRQSWAFRSATLALVALYSLQLWPALRPWHRAAAISREVSRQLIGAIADVPAGGVLILDVPGTVESAVCWAWAVPFATEPPFLSRDRDFEILGGPEIHAFPRQWPRQPIVGRLGSIDREGWILEVSPSGQVQRRRLSAQQLRTAAPLLANLEPETAADAWRRFLAALAPTTNR